MVLNEGKPTDPEGLTIEAWAEGYRYGMVTTLGCTSTRTDSAVVCCRESIVEGVELTLTVVGSLIVMACVTVANMRRGVLLHKLILVELIFGTFMGTVIFVRYNPSLLHENTRLTLLDQPAYISLVPERYRHPAKHQLVFAQRDCLDQE